MMRHDEEGRPGSPGDDADLEPRRLHEAPRDAHIREYGEGEHRPPRTPAGRDPWAIRAEDTEPYIGLQYVARLFKIVAMIVVVALVAEVVAGLMLEGSGVLLELLTVVIRYGVLAAMLWGAADLTLLFIDVGHDVRAARVLLGRLSARAAAGEPGQDRHEDPEADAHAAR